jgi:hypothetical protein
LLSHLDGDLATIIEWQPVVETLMAVRMSAVGKTEVRSSPGCDRGTSRIQQVHLKVFVHLVETLVEFVTYVNHYKNL